MCSSCHSHSRGRSRSRRHSARAANKTWIFKVLKFLRIIITIIFHIFTENSKSGCDLKPRVANLI